jgi:hypothetical protein
MSPGFNSTTAGGMFQASLEGVLSSYSWDLKGKLRHLRNFFPRGIESPFLLLYNREG